MADPITQMRLRLVIEVLYDDSLFVFWFMLGILTAPFGPLDEILLKILAPFGDTLTNNVAKRSQYRFAGLCVTILNLEDLYLYIVGLQE